MEAKRGILIVDADRDARHSLVSQFRRERLPIHEAPDAREALKHLEQSTYAVVLLDRLIPQSELQRVLRTIGAVPVSPIVLLMTADGSVPSEIGSSGVHGLVRKPLDLDEIAGLVRMCVELRDYSSLERMCIASVVVGSRFLDLLP